jgi:hypothetical protein
MELLLAILLSLLLPAAAAAEGGPAAPPIGVLAGVLGDEKDAGICAAADTVILFCRTSQYGEYCQQSLVSTGFMKLG